jgi:hypothetical protein
VLVGEELGAAVDMLDEHDVEPPSFGFLLRGECALVFDYLQDAASQAASSTEPAMDLGKTAKLFLKLFKDAERISKRPYSPENVARLKKLCEELGEQDLPGQVAAPRLDMPYLMCLRTLANRSANRLLFEMHIYRDLHGHWPEALDELSAHVIRRFGTDPFNGKEFRYFLADRDPWLHSVSTDGKDDGLTHDPQWGAGNPNTNYIFWPIHEVGFPRPEED